MRNQRLSQDAVVPVGNTTILTTNGATTLAVPVGASGIMMEGLWASTSYVKADDAVYWSVSAAMTAVDQGFSLSNVREPFILWFDPVAVPYIYMWLVNNATCVYLFLAKAGGKSH